MPGRGEVAVAPGAGLSFVHLHVHSPFSFLDGASSIDALVGKAREMGMPALAVTDHNSLSGAIRFYDRAVAAGVKPIIGAEVEVAGGYHLTLLARDLEGYSSLCRLLTDMHLGDFRGPAQATREMLAEHPEGLVALSGCSRGEIPALLAQGRREEAMRAAGFYQGIYPGRFYIELVYHPDGNGAHQVRRLVELAHGLGLPVAATNDVHHAEMGGYRTHELLNAMGQLTTVDRLPGPRTVEKYLKSPQEMAALFRDIPEAVRNTLKIADQCHLELPLGHPRFPHFPLPPGETAPGLLRRLALEGAERLYPGLPVPVRERLEHELAIIRHLGYETCFLVAWDIVRFARERGIRYQCRGSAVNSLAAYSLGISNVDPVEQDLLFERFMHQRRRELPDIDLDLQRTRRDEVRDYVIEKYGRENVAAVATINTFQARGSIREVGKALGMPVEVVEELQAGVRWAQCRRCWRRLRPSPS